MALLGVRGVISFCECQLVKDKKRLTVGKVKGMVSVSSGCDCCYLCFKEGMLRAEGDADVDQVFCSSCP